MRIVLLIGSHPRHLFVARQVLATGMVTGIVVETREHMLPTPPTGLGDDLRALFNRHFSDRDMAEQKAFGLSNRLDFDGNMINVTAETLNTPRVREFLDVQKPDLALVYGVHKLNNETLSHVQGRFWNIHGGLSPWYRGVTTLFWPSYMLEPQATGMTVHEVTSAIDGGPIVHQVAAPLVRGDGVHDLACRAVTTIAEEVKMLTTMLADDAIAPATTQHTVGKIWRARDWQPEHLQLIYELYENRIVDHYLNGRFKQWTPNLIHQF